MALVVLAHRHQVGARHEDVGRLQHRVTEQVVGDLVHAGGGGHILDRGQLLQPLDRHQAADQQLQLVDLVHGRLQVEGHLVRVDADGQVIHDDRPGVVGDHQDALLVGLGGEHVQVRDQEETFVLVLELEPVAVAAHKVAQVQLAGGPVAGQNALACCSWLLSSLSLACLDAPLRLFDGYGDCF